jgi:predicted PurR-regulated permease PerM
VAQRSKSFRWDHPVIITFLVIAVVASLSLAAEVVKPLALAVLLSFALAPLARFLERCGLPRPASVCLTIILALGVLAGASYVVGRQLATLAIDLPNYRENIFNKLRKLQPQGAGPAARSIDFLNELEEHVARTKRDPEVADVNVISQPNYRGRLIATVGPYLEFLGLGSFVLILVLFMLMTREDLRDRVTQLFGRRSVTLTTRTMDEAGSRISRYLGMFVLVNSAYGMVIGIGLSVIGVPFAILWGFLAAALRFIPYVGPAIAFGLPFLFSFAKFEGWWQPLEVVALFGIIEIVVTSFLEPVIYGKTTGISALGLIISAMFWTWLWGLLGLLLSTPLTVCLAVLGKYVPSLRVFTTLLGEESELSQDVRFYQRLLVLDQDGAIELIETARNERSRAEIFDRILIPALSLAERDFEHGEIDEREQAFIWRVTRAIVEDLAGSLDAAISAASTPANEDERDLDASTRVLGVVANNRGDELALRMLAQLVEEDGITMEVAAEADSPLALADVVVSDRPPLVVVSHLPPHGLMTARYVARRLHARLPDLPILIGCWGEQGDTRELAQKLTAVGATRVAFSLAEAKTRILETLRPKPVLPAAAGLAAVLK